MSKELDVGMKCIKYMLFVTNFMFAMVGFLLVSVGSTIKAIYEDFEIFMETRYFSPSTLAVCVGILMLLVSLFGCIGAYKESTCLIKTFALLLGLILVLELSAAIAAYTMRSNLKSTIRAKMFTSMKKYPNNFYDAEAWDFLQERFHCCGIDSPEDWENRTLIVFSMPPSGNSSWTGPVTCCPIETGPQKCEAIWKYGCLESLAYVVSECALLLGCGALAVAFVQFLGVVFANMLAKAVRKVKTQRLVVAEQRRQAAFDEMNKVYNETEKSLPVY